MAVFLLLCMCGGYLLVAFQFKGHPLVGLIGLAGVVAGYAAGVGVLRLWLWLWDRI